jgi:hypothetical protein
MFDVRQQHALLYVNTKMMLPCKLPASFATLTLTFTLTLAHPIWHDFNSRGSIDSFVTGSTFLLAGGVKFGVPYYLTAPLPSGTNHYSLLDARTPRVTHHHSSYTRQQQARPPVTLPYLPNPARTTAPRYRYSPCTMGDSFITRMNLISYM